MALTKVNPSLAALRNSAVVLLAAALTELFPSLQLVGGRATTRGFTYDVMGDIALDAQALPLIEERMRTLTARAVEVTSREMLSANAADYFRHLGQEVKADLLKEGGNELISLLQMGDFMDEALPPHVNTVQQLRAVRLLSIEKAETHFTINGTVQADERSLRAFMKRLHGAKETSHCLLGHDLGLFTIRSEICLWHPKGAVLRRLLLSEWEQFMGRLGLQVVSTTGFEPEVGLVSTRAARHAALYQTEIRSYRDLPLGYAESSEVYAETGLEEPCGLLGLPTYTAPEGHLFCLPEQVVERLSSLLLALRTVIDRSGFQTKAYLASGMTKDSKQAGRLLQEALKAANIPFEVDAEEIAPDGPRVDFRIIDTLGCEWLGPSLAINLKLPEQLKLRYQGVDDAMHRPVMLLIHLFGSLERWIGLLLEQTEGLLPFRLAPEQVRLLPIGLNQFDYAANVRDVCERVGLRVGIDARDQRLATKVFAFEKAKIPCALILGDQEQRQTLVTLRYLGQDTVGKTLTLSDFLDSLKNIEGVL